jgi:hypothetical protein
MFVRQQTGVPGLALHGIEERTRDVALEQAVPILTEGRGRPDRVIHAQANKPAKQHAVVDLFHQEPFTAYRVERLEQQRPQQLLGRNRRAANLRIHLREPRRQRGEHPVGHRANPAQRMVGAHALLGREITEHLIGLIVGSTHPIAPSRNGGSIVGHRDRSVDPPIGYFFINLLGFENWNTQHSRQRVDSTARLKVASLQNRQVCPLRERVSAPQVPTYYLVDHAMDRISWIGPGESPRV